MVFDVSPVETGTLKFIKSLSKFGMLLYALRSCLHQQQHNQALGWKELCNYIEVNSAATTLGDDKAAQLLNDNLSLPLKCLGHA